MDQKEFKEKIIPTGNKLYRFAWRMLQNTDDAKDVLQEVFMKLWKMRNELQKYRNIEAFAMTMVKNNCLDRLKTKKKNVGYEILDYSRESNHPDTPDKMLDRNEKIDTIKKCINSLPELQKMVVQLKDIEGFSFEEIKDMLNIEVNAIRVNLFRARQKIREYIKHINEYEYKNDT